MKTKLLRNFFAIFAGILLSLTFTYAVQSFSLSDTSLSDSQDFDQSGSVMFTITNNGTEPINLSVSKVDLTSGSESIGLSLSETSITNLAASSTQDITVSYTANDFVGTYTGSVTVENSDDPSQSETVDITLTVSTGGNASLEITGVGEPGSLINITGDVGDEEKEKIRFKNTGDVDIIITDIESTDLVGQNEDEEIEENDVDFEDTSFTVEAGDAESIDLEVDIDSDLPEDFYEGTITVSTNVGNFEWNILVIAEDDGETDVYINFNKGDVRSGRIIVFGEEGEDIDDIEIVVENDENRDVTGYRLRVEDGELVGEDSLNTLPSSAFSFSSNDIDIDEDDSEDIELTIDIPSGQAVDTYTGFIELVDSTGDDVDRIDIEVKVVGDVFIKDIKFNKDSYEPGDIMEVEVTVMNQGSRTYRDVNIDGIITDIDSTNSDETDSTGTFILDAREEEVKKLRFRLPDDAEDGEQSLEVRLEFGNQVEIEFEEFDVVRPLNNVLIESHSINPGSAKCEDNLFTVIKLENRGSIIEEVQVTTEIEGTGISRTSSEFDINVDETTTETFILDISRLSPGTYTVTHTVKGEKTFVEEDTLRVLECRDSSVGADIEPIDLENSTNGTGVDFDGELGLNDTSVYLGIGLGLVIILIIISLFLL